jgi:hypothetical protein
MPFSRLKVLEERESEREREKERETGELPICKM